MPQPQAGPFVQSEFSNSLSNRTSESVQSESVMNVKSGVFFEYLQFDLLKQNFKFGWLDESK